MAGFVKVAKVTDIEIGYHKSFVIGYDNIVIAHTEAGFSAFKDECSHDSSPFESSQEKLNNNQITCPRHGATFDVQSGVVTGPPALVPLEMYEIKIEGDDLLINLD